MSRTNRSTEHRNVGLLKVSRRMPPYGAEGKFKLKAIKTDHVPGRAKGVSKYDKLVTKNANRGYKKRMRRLLKEDHE